jgi:phenylacetate-coenzyme A ligase PaaK-like adenylate-forming protein
MVNYEEILNMPPYSLDKSKKHEFLTEQLSILTRHHYYNCPEYRKIIDAFGFDVNCIKSYCDIPFLPVRLFKEYDLLSVPREDVVKTMTSSGTTGQKVSKIYLDKETSSNQTKTLVKIVSSYIGAKRLPMIVIDTSAVLKDRNMFSARGAGILGFSVFARDRIFALDENMELDIDGLVQFLRKYEGEDILLFGFTYMIWQHFYNKLKELDLSLDLSRGVMIHGGGWKKLQEHAISPAGFKEALHHVCGINRVYDYYGMVEQTGTVYIECECGHLHSSVFSDVIIRRSSDFGIAETGEKGIIEVVSVLPKSYPGHVLLTEDEGIIIGEDDCPCGRKGKYFRITGRINNAEIRGCSDTYADRFK